MKEFLEHIIWSTLIFIGIIVPVYALLVILTN
jgi:hypothetical protein